MNAKELSNLSAIARLCEIFSNIKYLPNSDDFWYLILVDKIDNYSFLKNNMGYKIAMENDAYSYNHFDYDDEEVQEFIKYTYISKEDFASYTYCAVDFDGTILEMLETNEDVYEHCVKGDEEVDIDELMGYLDEDDYEAVLKQINKKINQDKLTSIKQQAINDKVEFLKEHTPKELHIIGNKKYYYYDIEGEGFHCLTDDIKKDYPNIETKEAQKHKEDDIQELEENLNSFQKLTGWKSFGKDINQDFEMFCIQDEKENETPIN